MLHWRPSVILLFYLTGWLAYHPDSVSAPESLTPSALAHDSSMLAPKPHKQMARGLEELRAGSSAVAQKRLDAVLRAAPDDLNANFILGICDAQTNHLAQAKDHWETVRKISPDHLGDLLSIGNALLLKNKPAEGE